MKEQNYQQLTAQLLLAARELEQAGDNSHAALCRKAALSIHELLESQGVFAQEEGGILRELSGEEVIALQPGCDVYVVHNEKGSWKDTVSEVMSFMDIHDVKLESGALLPMEEYTLKWRLYRPEET